MGALHCSGPGQRIVEDLEPVGGVERAGELAAEQGSQRFPNLEAERCSISMGRSMGNEIRPSLSASIVLHRETGRGHL